MTNFRVNGLLMVCSAASLPRRVDEGLITEVIKPMRQQEASPELNPGPVIQDRLTTRQLKAL